MEETWFYKNCLFFEVIIIIIKDKKKISMKDGIPIKISSMH